MRRSLVVLTAALVTLTATACGSPGTAAPSGPTAAATSPAALTAAQQHRLLEDTWVTPLVTRAQVVRGLADAGYGPYADTVALDLGYPTAFNLRFDAQSYWMRTATGLQPDHGSWELHGDRLVLLPQGCSPCEMHFAWRLQDDVLRLDLVRDTSPGSGGVPDEAFATALYGASPLTRYAAAP